MAIRQPTCQNCGAGLSTGLGGVGSSVWVAERDIVPASLKTLGCRVEGIDGSQEAMRDSVIPTCHVLRDYVDGVFRPEESFDLVWSCEFVEHVEQNYLDHFFETFSVAKKYVMMTYARPGQPGWHPVNWQPEGYWVEKLNGIGYEVE